MSPNQAFKAYMTRIASSPLPQVQAHHDLLMGLDRTARFQWFCAHKLPKSEPQVEETDDSRVGVDPFASTSSEGDTAHAIALLQAKGFVVTTPETPAPKQASKPRKTSKSSKAGKVTGESPWKRTTLEALVKNGRVKGSGKIGETFTYKGKQSTSTWLVLRYEGEKIIARKVA